MTFKLNVMLNWLIYAEAPTGIINSQVIDFARRFERQHNMVSTIWVLSPLSNYWTTRRSYQNVCGSINVRIVPLLPFQGKHFCWKWNCVLLALATTGKPSALWLARGPKSGEMVLGLKRFRRNTHLVYLSRGSVHDEVHEHTNHSSGLVSIASEKRSLVHANHVMAVSPQLIKRHEELYGDIGILNRCSICPTLIDSKRIIDASEKRARNVNPLRVAFVGGGQTWQSLNLLNAGLTALITSSQAEIVHFRYLGNPSDIENIKFDSRITVQSGRVQPNDVVRELAKYDYGLLLRDYSYTNKVSTPTKFAEYCAAGLIPVISGVPFFENLMNERQVPFGSFHPGENSITWHHLLADNAACDRDRIVEFVRKDLSEQSPYFQNFVDVVKRFAT